MTAQNVAITRNRVWADSDDSGGGTRWAELEAFEASAGGDTGSPDLAVMTRALHSGRPQPKRVGEGEGEGERGGG